jgi:hypothetical protein
LIKTPCFCLSYLQPPSLHAAIYRPLPYSRHSPPNPNVWHPHPMTPRSLLRIVFDFCDFFNMKKIPDDAATMRRWTWRRCGGDAAGTWRRCSALGDAPLRSARWGDTPLRSVRGRETLRFAPRVGRRSASLRAWGRHSASLRAREGDAPLRSARGGDAPLRSARGGDTPLRSVRGRDAPASLRAWETLRFAPCAGRRTRTKKN